VALDLTLEPSEMLEIDDDALADLAPDRSRQQTPPGEMSIV
jgi:hypothetical protein